MMSAAAGLPESLVGQVKAVDGVATAVGYVAGSGAVAVNGKVVGTGGSPTLFFSYSPGMEDLQPTTFMQGAPPARSGEVGIIQKLAKDKKLGVGSRLQVITPTGSRPVTVSGVFTFAAQSSLGGSILIHTTLPDAQQWFDLPGQVSEIDVKGVAGVTPEALAGRVRAVVPPGSEVKTGTQAAADQTKQVSDAIGGFLRPVLLSVGGITVFVGAFIIFNAFSMTVAQRRREFAMVRALGASRRQVLASVAVEALAMGVLASLLGLLAGLGVAAAVIRLLRAVGVDIPHSSLVLAPRTIVVALAVGILVTLLSALIPAARATRVPPMVALQEGAVLPPSRLARCTPFAAAGVAILGALFIAAGMFGPGGTTQRLEHHRARSHPLLHRRGHGQPLPHPPDRGRTGLAAAEALAGQRPAGARQQHPQSRAHGGDGVGVDDRRRRGRVRGRVRPGAQELVHRRHRPHGARRLHRAGPELHAAPERRRGQGCRPWKASRACPAWTSSRCRWTRS